MPQTFSVPCDSRYKTPLSKAGIFTPEDVVSATEKPAGIGKAKWEELVQKCSSKNPKGAFKVPKQAVAVTNEHTWYNKNVHIIRKNKAHAAIIDQIIVEKDRISMVVWYYVNRKKVCILKSPSNIFASYQMWLDQKVVSDDSEDDEVKDPEDPIFMYEYDGPPLPRLEVTASRNLLTDADWERMKWVETDVNELIS